MDRHTRVRTQAHTCARTHTHTHTHTHKHTHTHTHTQGEADSSVVTPRPQSHVVFVLLNIVLCNLSRVRRDVEGALSPVTT